MSRTTSTSCTTTTMEASGKRPTRITSGCSWTPEFTEGARLKTMTLTSALTAKELVTRPWLIPVARLTPSTGNLRKFPDWRPMPTANICQAVETVMLAFPRIQVSLRSGSWCQMVFQPRAREMAGWCMQHRTTNWSVAEHAVWGWAFVENRQWHVKWGYHEQAQNQLLHEIEGTNAVLEYSGSDDANATWTVIRTRRWLK